MKIKLDENFDARLVPALSAAGHEVDTVRDEGLSGSDDDTIYATCVSDRRVLITLDLDFANPFRFPHENTEGIIVVRPPRPILSAIHTTPMSVLPQLDPESLKGALWIVEPGRIRVHESRNAP